jgi:hypothetical protein
MSRDIFRPTQIPAQLFYDAFQDEAKHRDSRTFEEWNRLEIERVWKTARDYAQQHDLKVPTLEEVKNCERYASGHTDYGSQWAYGVARLLKKA